MPRKKVDNRWKGETMSTEFRNEVSKDLAMLMPDAFIGLHILVSKKRYEVKRWEEGKALRSNVASEAGQYTKKGSLRALCSPDNEMGVSVSVDQADVFRYLCDRLRDAACPQDEKAVALWSIFRAAKCLSELPGKMAEQMNELDQQLKSETPDVSGRYAIIQSKLLGLKADWGTMWDSNNSSPHAYAALNSGKKLHKVFAAFNVRVSLQTVNRYARTKEPPGQGGKGTQQSARNEDEELYDLIISMDEDNEPMTFDRVASVASELLPQANGVSKTPAWVKQWFERMKKKHPDLVTTLV